MASDLDAWLGRGPWTESWAPDSGTKPDDNGDAIQRTGEIVEQDPWILRARSEGPSVWRQRGNPHTEALAVSLAADAELPMEGTPARDCRKVAADLLTEASGDEGLILRAQERCRREGNWRGLSLYIQKKSLVHELHKIRAARRQFSSLLSDDPVAEEDPMMACPRCGKRVYPERVDDDCRGH